jgi:hypothetical protein
VNPFGLQDLQETLPKTELLLGQLPVKQYGGNDFCSDLPEV